MSEIKRIMINQLQQKFSSNDSIYFVEARPGFPVIKISNKWATASISLYGGQLLSFQPHSQEQPVIWLSDKVIFKKDKAIRGGIPLCWPWFGSNEQFEDQPAHGYARISLWELINISTLANGEIKLELHMPCQQYCQEYQNINPSFHVDLSISYIIGQELAIDLRTHNTGDTPVILSNALHSYFNVSHIEDVSVLGLDGATFIDKLLSAKKQIQNGSLQIKKETDRIYLDSNNDIILNDSGYKRQINVSKKGADSTVVWNPWQQKSHSMDDMSDNGWKSMICIESANVDINKLKLNPGQNHRLHTTISVKKLVE